MLGVYFHNPSGEYWNIGCGSVQCHVTIIAEINGYDGSFLKLNIVLRHSF